MMRKLLIACTALLALAGPVRAEEPSSSEAACAAFVDSARDVDAWTRPLYERDDLAALGLPACEARLEAAPEDASLMAAVGVMRILAGPENGRGLLERAAERGERLALEALFAWRIAGVEDGNKTLIAPDMPLAFDYGRRAVEAGSVQAQYLMGLATFYGEHMEKDEERGLAMLRAAAARSGDPAIKADLGAALLGPPPYRRGLTEREAEGAKFLSEAAEAGAPKGLFLIGLLMVTTSDEDRERGLELMREAAEKGERTAAHILGMYYASGAYVERDARESERFLCMAGRRGELLYKEYFDAPPQCPSSP